MKVLQLNEVESKTRKASTQIYAEIAAGTFPRKSPLALAPSAASTRSACLRGRSAIERRAGSMTTL